MVGREDEAHFMLPAGWWSTAGLVLSLIGVLLLFRYGMPYRVRTGGSSIYVSSSSDPREATLERRYDMLGWFGLLLVVLGTICQIVGAVLGAT
jgi:hypothetical protein